MSDNKRVKLSCYLTCITMAVTANVSPLLFVTFNESYGISFSLLGLLIVLNFTTQIIVDLVFSFFGDRLDPHIAVKLTPPLALLGLSIYALSPIIFAHNVYIGLVIGTVIASAASGLAEVLTSPLIASIPADNPDAELSKLHSVYAWGTVGVILFSTLFFVLFTTEYWYVLMALFLVIPLISTLLFVNCTLPEIKRDKGDGASPVKSLYRHGILYICLATIFMGGATELAMAQWASSYLEAAIGIPKAAGDIFGAALFAMMMGIGRTLYTKYGRHIELTLLLSAVGATVCYLIAALSPLPILTLIACGMTGLFSSMLWPGTLIIIQDRIKGGGVMMFALMAAGGDLGASVAPQLIGAITDLIAASSVGGDIASELGITAQALGMKAGMLISTLFPLIAIALFFYLYKTRTENKSLSVEAVTFGKTEKD